jgi:hypothetical protein
MSYVMLHVAPPAPAPAPARDTKGGGRAITSNDVGAKATRRKEKTRIRGSGDLTTEHRGRKNPDNDRRNRRNEGEETTQGTSTSSEKEEKKGA